MQHKADVILAFGSNEVGAWGAPKAAIERAFAALGAAGVEMLARSSIAMTAPVGPIVQPPYANAAGHARTWLSPAELLAALKQMEWEAGRRNGVRWGPRPLDIDIIDYAGVVTGWDRPHDPMQPLPLVLPHPEMHKRAFVLEPVAEIAPNWRHPVFGKTAAELLAGLGLQQR